MIDILMSSCWPLALSLLVSWPLLLALLSFQRLVRPGVVLWLGLPVMLLATLVSFQAGTGITESPLLLSLGGWASPLGIQWQLDQAAAWLLLTVNLISVAAALSAWLFGPSLGGSAYFWPLWWLLWGGMNALVVSADLFNLYVTLELVTLTAVGLVAQSRNDPEGKAAMQYLMASLLASLLYLLGVALIYGQTGVLDLLLLPERLQEGALMQVAAVCMTLGLLLKAAVVPLHFWLPEAHSRAQAPVSVVLSSVVIALAIYLLWRLWLGPFLPLLETAQPFFTLLATLCLLWGGVQALLQRRLKLVLAYSTLSQLGFALMLLSLQLDDQSDPWLSLAGQGSLMFLLAHGLAKAALFMVAGVLMLHFASDRLRVIQGSGGQLAVAWLAFVLASISLLGAPPTAGFAGKWQLLQAALQQQDGWTVMLLLVGTLMTAVYLFRVMQFAWRPAVMRQTLHGVSWRVRLLSWLALFTALTSWLVGVLVLGGPGWQLFSPPALDWYGQVLLLPVLLVWPVALLLSWGWRLGKPLLVLLTLGWLLNLLLLFAQDLLSFYLVFALLSFLGWWLVIQPGHAEALAAGRVYLGMSLVGELAFFLGIGLLAGFSLSFTALAEQTLPAAGLLAIGLALAIKAGALGVHFWLPVAHPVAPTPASAVLSGLMIKAGVLGALRIHASQDGLESWGWVLVLLGLIGVFYTLWRGLLQSNPKTLLAWSSVSQVSLMTALLGAGLMLQEQARDLALLSLVLLAATHALAKASLFLAVGLKKTLPAGYSVWLLAGVLLAGLTLAGAPWLAGMLVKQGVDVSFAAAGLPGWLLLLSSLITSLLLGRLLWLLALLPPTADARLHPAWLLPWGLLVLSAAGYAWFWPQTQLQVEMFSIEAILKGALPPVVALLLLLGYWRVQGSPRQSAVAQSFWYSRMWRWVRVHWQRPFYTGLSGLEKQLQNWFAMGLLLAWVAALLGGLLAYSLIG
ncbi:proton-conducting transporter membrane subunit [Marinospirillum alkaliphilum]|uniref:Formate hydrogenlyase subunit 3/Multisubunit Na+/H+ antiporter, MnhD subunit n=1 Tax=Marinospirillum alkaliphilum DSM 21637 TaxID=1122209 RepID=A0A1K1ZZE0_9GAMM|nr:proton-conducting transporter membrane subunit [Marinospirillum alkaliphilum]SFX79634.1 Formate hydrogenlyase subunit 3/Multisubunit Na+/H+ antiporter, MnhD subunit [Marinospirillum alkaliphilum DSM 21637]